MGILIFSVVYLGVPQNAKADLKSELQKKQQLQDSVKQQQDQKQQQQAVAEKLKSEVDGLNKDIQSTQNAINKLNGEINQVENDISDLTNQINQQTAQIETKKSELETAIDSMYIDGATSGGDVVTVAHAGNISELVSDQQSYQMVENEIDGLAKQIEDLRAKTEAQKTDLEKKQNTLKDVQGQQIQQKNALNNQISLKNKLLSDTNATISGIDSTISQYQEQIVAVDGKISSFLAQLTAQTHAAATGDLIVGNKQPWHYSQRDVLWAAQRLNPDSSGSDTFAESGCLVTSVTMVANRYGFGGTPPEILAKLRDSGAMSGDLLMWSGVSDAFGGKLDFVTGGKERTDWGVIDASLTMGKPVIVHVKGGSYGHWIVIAGKIGDKYEVEDPYFEEGQVYSHDWIDYMARLQPTSS